MGPKGSQDWDDLIPRYLEGELSPEEESVVRECLKTDEQARLTLRAYESSWEILHSWPDDEPSPGYVSRFWTRLARQRPWTVRLKERFRASPVWQPAYALVALVMVIIAVISRENILFVKTEDILSEMSLEEMAIVENLELLENYDVLAALDVLEDEGESENEGGSGQG